MPRSLEADLNGTGLRIAVDLGVAKGKGEAWGTDLSEEYVRINADYTT